MTTSLRVLSAGVMRRIVSEVAAEFRRETGHVVDLTVGTVGVLKETAASGAPVDVLVLTDAAIDELAERGIVEPGTRVDLARTAVGVGIRRGAPLPDVSTAEALRDTLLRVGSIAYTDPAHGGTSGVHFAEVLRRLGIAHAVSGKAVLWPGGSAAEAVVRGQAELVVHQISEILAVEGVMLVGPLPPDAPEGHDLRRRLRRQGLGARRGPGADRPSRVSCPQAQARGRRPGLPGIGPSEALADTIDTHSRAAQSRSTGNGIHEMSRARPDVVVPP